MWTASKTRRLVRRMLLSLAVSVLALAVAEGLTRYLRPELRRSALYRIMSEESVGDWSRPDESFHHVGDGIFHLDFPAASAGANARILITGDSFAMGQGVAGQERFGALLAQSIAAQSLGGRTAVDVLATSSYSPAIYRNIVRRALEGTAYAYVFVFVDQTDPIDDLIYESDVRTDDPLRFDVARMSRRRQTIDRTYAAILAELAPGPLSLRDFALYNGLNSPHLLRYLPPADPAAEYVHLARRLRRPLILAFNQGVRTPQLERARQLLVEHLDEIAALCEQARVPLVLAANPWEYQVAASPGGMSRVSGLPARLPCENRLESLLAEHFAARGKVAVLGLTRAFRAYPEPARLFLHESPNEIHWGPAGHRLVADEVRAVISPAGSPGDSPRPWDLRPPGAGHRND